MKKLIKTYDELLVSLASKGDPVAFYNLSLSYFQNQYISLRQDGKNDAEARKKILNSASEMYKKLSGSKQINIDALFQEEVSESASDTAEFHLEKTSYDRECSIAMNVLNRHLQKLSGRQNHKKISEKSRLFRNPFVKSAVFVALAAILFTGLYIGLHLSGTFVQFSFNHKGKELSFSFPFQSKDNINRIETPVIPVKPVEKIDSVKSVSTQTVDSTQIQPVKPVKHHKKTVISSNDPSLQSPQIPQNTASGTITQSTPQTVKNEPQMIQKTESRIPTAPVTPQTP